MAISPPIFDLPEAGAKKPTPPASNGFMPVMPVTPSAGDREKEKEKREKKRERREDRILRDMLLPDPAGDKEAFMARRKAELTNKSRVSVRNGNIIQRGPTDTEAEMQAANEWANMDDAARSEEFHKANGGDRSSAYQAAVNPRATRGAGRGRALGSESMAPVSDGGTGFSGVAGGGKNSNFRLRTPEQVAARKLSAIQGSSTPISSVRSPVAATAAPASAANTNTPRPVGQGFEAPTATVGSPVRNAFAGAQQARMDSGGAAGPPAALAPKYDAKPPMPVTPSRPAPTPAQAAPAPPVSPPLPTTAKPAPASPSMAAASTPTPEPRAQAPAMPARSPLMANTSAALGMGATGIDTGIRRATAPLRAVADGTVAVANKLADTGQNIKGAARLVTGAASRKLTELESAFSADMGKKPQSAPPPKSKSLTSINMDDVRVRVPSGTAGARG